MDLKFPVPLKARVLLWDLLEGNSFLELKVEVPIGPCMLEKFVKDLVSPFVNDLSLIDKTNLHWQTIFDIEAEPMGDRSPSIIDLDLCLINQVHLHDHISNLELSVNPIFPLIKIKLQLFYHLQSSLESYKPVQESLFLQDGTVAFLGWSALVAEDVPSFWVLQNNFQFIFLHLL